MKKIFTKYLPKVIFILPFILYLYCIQSFYFQGTIGGDAIHSYTSMNYYLNNLARGVYPTWNPFNAWGRPDDLHVRFWGEFNPVVYIVLILNALGIPYFAAYFFYLVLYFFIGILGFYCLARRIYKDHTIAYLAMILLLFSTIGVNAFCDLQLILLFVPIAWFFYFLTAFSQSPQRHLFIGLTFTLMVISTTYMPVFFIIVFASFLLLFSLFYSAELKNVFERYRSFLKANKFLGIGCSLLLLCSLIPGISYMHAFNQKDYVTQWRSAQLSMEIISASGVVGRGSLKNLFSYLDILNFGDLYIPIFAGLVLLIGMIVPATRRLTLFFCMGMFLMVVSLGQVSAVFRFLYQHVYLFQLFRNLHFLMWFSIGVWILFICGQFQWFCSDNSPLKRRRWAEIYVIVILIAAAVFLFQQERILVSTFWTVALTAAFFMMICKGWIRFGSNAFLAALLFIVSLQPIEVYSHSYIFRGGSGPTKFIFKYPENIYTRQESIPRFSFMRPARSEKLNKKLRESFIEVGDVSDTSGFVSSNYYGLSGSYFLLNNFDWEEIENYVRHKFVVYDHVEMLDADQLDTERISQVFAQMENKAFVNIRQRSLLPAGLQARQERAIVIEKSSSEFQVLDFDVNRIKFKTNFKEPKFLIYNDSYHKAWKATINGKKAPIFQANIAFKGLWLGPGENTISLVYRREYELISKILLILFFGVFLLLIYETTKKRLYNS